jgi:CDP-diacylglycerol---glycerol-3-phosphate 3-phosphatidyltransferase
MPSIYDIKPEFQALLRPLTERLAAIGITANQVTVAAAVLSVVSGLLIAAWPDSNWPLLVLPATLFIRMALNAIDGMLAREHGMKSRFGAILNELGDVFSDASLYLPLAVVPGISAPLIVMLTLLSVISEMTGVVAVQIGSTRRYDGPLGKSDRAFAIGLLSLVLVFGVPRGDWLNIYLAVLVVLAFVTVINRARHALREVA